MRGEILRAGMAVALVGSAAACAKESDNPNVNHYSVPPGQCETISKDIAVCNRKGSTARYAEIKRLNNGYWDEFSLKEIEEDIRYRLTGALEGLSLLLDSDGIIYLSVTEPLLSATPVPTLTPPPTPFKFEPLKDPDSM